MFALELARRYGDKGIVSISLNPGNLKTDLDRHAKWLNSIVLVSIASWILVCFAHMDASGSYSYGPRLGARGRLYGLAQAQKTGMPTAKYVYLE